MNKVFSLLSLFLIFLIGCQVLEEQDIGETTNEGEPQVEHMPLDDVGAGEVEMTCAEPQPAFVTDLEIHKPPQYEEPDARAAFRDPVFATCLIRVTDREQDMPADHESTGLKNEYARVQAFNADGSLLLIYGTEGEWFLYDAASLAPIGGLPLGVEPRWDAQDPHLITFTDETRLMAYDLSTSQESLIHDFAGDLDGQTVAAVWTAFEGRPSRDTRYWGLMAENEEWLPTTFLVYDRKNDSVTMRDMRGVPGIEDDVDHVTISPLGTYFLAGFDHYCEEGQLGNDERPCGLMGYDQNLQNGRGLLRTVGHYDVALNANGKEVIIFQDIDHDQIAMLDIESSELTPLWDIDFSHTPIGFHFSGLAYDRPGWALLSTYSGGYPDAYTWMDDQIFAVELKADGRVLRLAHTHALVNEDLEHDYWAEPQATVNPDFTRILFTTNWGRSGTAEVETYMIQLPEAWDGEQVRAAAEPPDQILEEEEAAVEPVLVEPKVETVVQAGGPIIIDHTTTDLSQISDEWLAAAKENVVWIYGSTSHGTQVWTGAEYLSANVDPPTYAFSKEWWDPPQNPAQLSMGFDDGWSWDPGDFMDWAREMLDTAPEATAFMWSWCGEPTYDDSAVPHYLEMMDRLEAEYPNITFVYMTGHTEEDNDQLQRNNDLIRDHVQKHGKLLYDFADIESYDPAGNYYPNADDSCLWCDDWCSDHPEDCQNLPGTNDECAHSHGFNCKLKGQAFWWLSVRLAGWEGE